MARRILHVGLGALAAAVVLTLAWSLSLGAEPTLGEVVASYLRWGRWAVLAMAVVYGALVVAAPFLPDAGRSWHVIWAGALVSLVGTLLALSQLPGDVDPDGRLSVDVTAGQLSGLSGAAPSAFVAAGGAVLLGLGLLMAAAGTADRRMGRASGLAGAAFVAAGLTRLDVLGSAGLHRLAALAAMGLLGYWLLAALRAVPRSEHRIEAGASSSG